MMHGIKNINLKSMQNLLTFFPNLHNKMAAVPRKGLTFSSVSGNLGSLVWRLLIKMYAHFVWSIACKVTVADMAVV
jgi:hypothetical protein